MNRYELLVKYLTDYIYTVTVRNGVAVETTHGPGSLPITGYTPEEYQQDPDLWYRMIHPKDRERVLAHTALALSGNDPSPVEHRIIHRDGTTRWIRNTIIVTRHVDGTVRMYDGLINDITDLKRAQAAAAQRSRELRQSEKMASLGTLVAGIAHEINNPNNFLMLNAQLFTKMWKDVIPLLEEHFRSNGDFLLAGIPYSQCREKVPQSLEGITAGSERISAITKRLTAYSKLDSDVLNELVDVNAVVETAIAITHTLLKSSTEHFAVEYGTLLPRVKGNAQQLEQVVINLLTNACQSLEDPSKRIHVVTSFDAERSRVRIAVTDEGIGITHHDMKFILDPFFTTKRNTGGTGLGLSVSYTIIKNHHGILKFRSEEGKGTSAVIHLPLPKELETPNTPPSWT